MSICNLNDNTSFHTLIRIDYSLTKTGIWSELLQSTNQSTNGECTIEQKALSKEISSVFSKYPKISWQCIVCTSLFYRLSNHWDLNFDCLTWCQSTNEFLITHTSNSRVLRIKNILNIQHCDTNYFNEIILG